MKIVNCKLQPETHSRLARVQIEGTLPLIAGPEQTGTGRNPTGGERENFVLCTYRVLKVP